MVEGAGFPGVTMTRTTPGPLSVVSFGHDGGDEIFKVRRGEEREADTEPTQGDDRGVIDGKVCE